MFSGKSKRNLHFRTKSQNTNKRVEIDYHKSVKSYSECLYQVYLFIQRLSMKSKASDKGFNVNVKLSFNDRLIMHIF